MRTETICATNHIPRNGFSWTFHDVVLLWPQIQNPVTYAMHNNSSGRQIDLLEKEMAKFNVRLLCEWIFFFLLYEHRLHLDLNVLSSCWGIQ